MGIFLYIVKRSLVAMVLLLVASFLVYAGVRATVDPTAGLVASKDKNARAELREKLGLNRPIISQYKEWLSNAVKGDLGVGDRDNEKVTTKLKRGLTGTAELIIWGVILASSIGIIFGVIAAIRRNHPLDYALSGFSYLGVALPVFAFAYVLTNLFAYYLPIKVFGQSGPWLFSDSTLTGSFGRSSNGLWSVDSVVQYLRNLTLPAVVLSIQLIASWSRYQRSSMIEALQSDYIRTAYAKGMSKSRVYLRHALRNSEIPMVTVMALDIGLLLQGLIYTEIIFSVPGMSRVFVKALDLGDATTITGWVMVTATFIIVSNLIADLLLPFIDPRIRTR